MIAQCRGCNAAIVCGGRGRPPEWCDACKRQQKADRNKARRDEIAEANAAKARAAKANVNCIVCGEPLYHPNTDSCGFCEEEAA